MCPNTSAPDAPPDAASHDCPDPHDGAASRNASARPAEDEPPGEEAEGGRWPVGGTWMALIATVVVLAAFKAAAAVAVPVAASLFLIALFWPVQRRLARRTSPGVALLANVALFLGLVALFWAALIYSAHLVERSAQTAAYVDQIRAMYRQAASAAQAYGLALPTLGAGASGEGGGVGQGVLLSIGERLASAVSLGTLTFAFFVLGLLEVRAFREKVETAPAIPSRTWIEVAYEVARGVQRYVVVRTFVGLVTGLLVWLYCWTIGLDFAFIWGLSNFLLNYIPTLGSIVGVVPPSLFGLVQFSGWEAALVPLGVAGVQLLMGHFVDPLLQGRYLALSPYVVLVAVTFWGWLWGVAGAFLSMPITVGIAVACQQSERTRWLATFLAEDAHGRYARRIEDQR